VRTVPEKLRGRIPVVGDIINGIYFRPEAGGRQILVGSLDPQDENDLVTDPDHYDEGLDGSFRLDKLHLLHHRIETLEHRAEITGYASLYDVNSQDWHPVIDATEVGATSSPAASAATASSWRPS